MYIPQGCVATALEEEDMAALQHQYPGHAGAHARLAAEACAGRTTATEHSTNAYSWCRPHVPNTHLRHWLRQQTDISNTRTRPPPHPCINTCTICSLWQTGARSSAAHTPIIFSAQCGKLCWPRPGPQKHSKAGDRSQARLSSSQNLPAHCWHVLGPSPVPRQHSSTTRGSQEKTLSGQCSGATEAGRRCATHTLSTGTTNSHRQHQHTISTPAAQQHHLRWQALQDSSMLQLNRPWLPAVLLRTIIVAAAHSLTHTHTPRSSKVPAAGTAAPTKQSVWGLLSSRRAAWCPRRGQCGRLLPPRRSSGRHTPSP